jgi:RNA polymerase sigma-70 factor (ECF subfamily)
VTPIPAHPDLVLQHLAWVRDLARALVRDVGRADDLVQDTWLRVRQSPPPAGRRDREWLGRVVRNLARDLRRGEDRRERRERAAARPEALPSDDALRDTLARQEELARWVRELDEPYRRTLLLRWLEGHDAERIATGEGVPVATVRTRLRRGEALLRERAERETRGAGQRWLAALAGDVSLLSLPPIVAPSTAPLVVLVAMQAKLVIAVVLVAVCAWLVSRPPAHPGPSAPVDALTADATLAHSVDLDTPATEGPTTSGRAQATTAAAATATPPANEIAPPAVELTPGRDLAVRVVDPAGAPIVGATVIVRSGDGSAARDALRAVTSAPDGEVRFLNLAVEVDRNWGDRESVSLALELVGDTKVGAALDVDALPAEPIVLVAPAHGRLDVRFVDAAGAPLMLDEWVYLTPYPPDPLQPREQRRGTRMGAYARHATTASFPIVEPGTVVLFEVYDNGIRRGTARELAPFVAGEVRALEVELGETLPHVVGRIVDETGAPVPARSIDVEFEPSGSARIYEVGADGSFALNVTRLQDATDEFAALLRVELQAPNSQRHEVQRLSGRFVARVPRDATPVDAGTVVMRAAPVILAGRIVDADGAPIDGAYISVYEKGNQRAEAEVFDWHFASVDYAYSDSEGQVVVQSDLPVGEYAARAHAEGWVDRGAQRFQLGVRGLEFVLDRAHFIRGRVHLPEGTRLEDLEVELRKEGASREWLTYATWRTGLAADGSFLLADVRPDVVSLQLKRIHSAATLAVIEGMTPTPTRDHVHPSLDPWDLAGDVVHITTRVHLADGRPAPIGLVAVGQYAAALENGHCDATFERSAGTEALFVAPGHIPTRLPLDSIPRRIDLVQGTPIEVSLASPPPAIPEGWSLELALRPDRFTFVPEDHFINAGGRFGVVPEALWLERIQTRPGESAWTLHAPEPGHYHATWLLSSPSADPTRRSGPSQTLRSRPERESITVDRVPGPPIPYKPILDPASIAESTKTLQSLDR